MSEEPGREGGSDDMSRAPSAGQVIAGVLLLLFGLCLLLVGGGCTIVWVAILFDSSSWGHESGAGLLLVSLAVAAGGIISIVQGVKMLHRRSRAPTPAVAEAGPDEPLSP